MSSTRCMLGESLKGIGSPSEGIGYALNWKSKTLPDKPPLLDTTQLFQRFPSISDPQGETLAERHGINGARHAVAHQNAMHSSSVT